MRTFLFSTFIVLWASLVTAEELKLAYGVNHVDINADGKEDLIIKSRWENFNAHSFDKYLILIHLDGEFYKRKFYEVPLGLGYNYSFRNSEGADCILTDYRFELIDHKLQVTKYKREYGESFADSKPVTITKYALVDSTEATGYVEIGIAPFYLDKVQEGVTEQGYCDVRELM